MSNAKDLIELAGKQGYLTEEQIKAHLPEEITKPEQIKAITQMIKGMEIKVKQANSETDV